MEKYVGTIEERSALTKEVAILVNEKLDAIENEDK